MEQKPFPARWPESTWRNDGRTARSPAVACAAEGSQARNKSDSGGIAQALPVPVPCVRDEWDRTSHRRGRSSCPPSVLIWAAICKWSVSEAQACAVRDHKDLSGAVTEFEIMRVIVRPANDLPLMPIR